MEISSFDEYVIEKINVIDEINRHSICIVDLVVSNEEWQCFQSDNKIGSDSFSVSYDGEIVFSGLITKIQSKRTYLKTCVRVTAYSFSYSMDFEMHNRIFQNPKKSYGKINEFLNVENVKIKCLDEGISDEEIEEILIQRNETDFDFVKRIYNSKKLNLYIVNNKKNTCTIEVANNRGNNKYSIDLEDIIKCECEKTQTEERVIITTNKLFEIGGLVSIDGIEYSVVSRCFINEYEKNEIEYSMICIYDEKDEDRMLNSFNLGIAKVVANSSEDHLGKIQVEFIDYEDALSDERIWIDYVSPLTEKNGGIVFVPDLDELVEIIYRNGKCISTGCIRTNELDEKIQDVNKRYIYVRDSLLVWDEKSIDIQIGNNRISVTDEEVIVDNDNFETIINADQCKIGFEKAKVLMDKEKLQLFGKNVVEIKADKANIEGSAGVKVKTKSFDVG